MLNEVFQEFSIEADNKLYMNVVYECTPAGCLKLHFP